MCAGTECRTICNADRDCTDSDVCNGIETCASGLCRAAPALECDDANACTTDACDALSGCTHLNMCSCTTAAECDDNNPCTTDVCDGSCQNVPNTADCSDGDLCNGVEICADGLCTPGLPLACADGDGCTVDACEPLSGCTHTNNCTCSTPADCNDNNPCTDDVCNGSCSYLPNSNSCSDGNVCNGAESCANGACSPALPLNCDDGNACTADSCEPLNGCVHGTICTCTSPADCNDNNPCTDDVCNGACSNPPNSASCSDGNLCNGNEVCGAGACQPGTSLVCNDGNPCTDDGCAPSTGCTAGMVPNGEPRAGCNAAAAANGCSAADACDGQGGCNLGNAPPTQACNDGIACSHTDHCDGAGGCAGTMYSCNDGVACTGDSCTGDGGCSYPPLTGTACGYCGTCNAGTCQPGDCPPWARPPGNTADSLNGLAWDYKWPIRIGAAVGGDELTYSTPYRTAVTEQFGIVTMEVGGLLARLAPTSTMFQSGAYDWAEFDLVANFACDNNMALVIAHLFWEEDAGLGGAKDYLLNADYATVRQAMSDHALRVMNHVRQLAATRCPDLQIYVNVVNEGIIHQENGWGTRLWYRANGPSPEPYEWTRLAFQYTAAADTQARSTYGGTRPAKLYYNETGAENWNDGGFGRTVYTKLAAWKSAGWQINGVGFQSHMNYARVVNILQNNAEGVLMGTLNAYGSLGFETQISEADYIMPFNRNDGLYWRLDAVWGVCGNNSYNGAQYWVPPNYPAADDYEYNLHPYNHAAMFRACLNSNSCVAHVIWGVFDHAFPYYAWVQCHGAPVSEWGIPNAGAYGYGHPVIFDCMPDANGDCVNDGTYYHKRAYHYLWAAIHDRLVFNARDARGTTVTGDWAPGSYKAECSLADRVTGLSVSLSTKWAHAALCRNDGSGRYPHASCRTLTFLTGDSRGTTVTGDWDPSNYKGECGLDEYVAGVSQQTADHRMSSILCCQGSVSHASCTAEVMQGQDAREPVSNGADYAWDYGYWKGECGDQRYVAGVSANASWAPQPGAPHAILCCSP